MPKQPQLRRLKCAFVAGLTLGSAIAWGGPPWKGKDPASWTPKEVEQVLAASPWAQSAVASFMTKDSEAPATVAPLPGAAQAGLAGPRGVTDGRWDGGVGRNTYGVLPTLNVSIRWDSALPVQEALKKSQQEQSVLSAHPNSYVLTLVGLVPAGRYSGQGRLESSSSSDDSGPDRRNPEQALEAFMTSSALRIPGRRPIAPEDVKFEPQTGALHFYFSRKEPIAITDKEVLFVTRFGSLYVEKRFRLKEMAYKGHLEL